jgi:hypothetical protein
VVPPKLFCMSPEVILEYRHDSIPEEVRRTFNLNYAKLPQGLLNNREECCNSLTEDRVVARGGTGRRHPFEQSALMINHLAKTRQGSYAKTRPITSPLCDLKN